MIDIDRVFREYTAAIADNETGDAAEIYANYADNEKFNLLTKAFHAIVGGFNEGRQKGSITFLKEELYFDDYQIAELQNQFSGTSCTIDDFVAAILNLQSNLRKQGVEMSPYEIHQMLENGEGFL